MVRVAVVQVAENSVLALRRYSRIEVNKTSQLAIGMLASIILMWLPRTRRHWQLRDVHTSRVLPRPEGSAKLGEA